MGKAGDNRIANRAKAGWMMEMSEYEGVDGGKMRPGWMLSLHPLRSARGKSSGYSVGRYAARVHGG